MYTARGKEHRIDWELVEELLLELSEGQPYSMKWAAAVMGCDERNTYRYRMLGVPDRIVESLLERANRGITYDVLHPPAPGSIDNPYDRVYMQVRVPWEKVEPFIQERLGEAHTAKSVQALFGVGKRTIYDWKEQGMPLDRVLHGLNITIQTLGLEVAA